MGLLFGGHAIDLGGSRVLSRAFGDVFEGRGLGSGDQYPNPKPPLPSGQDRSASFHDRGVRRTGDQPGSAGIVRPCALALPPGNRARRMRPEGTGSMALSMRAETVAAPQTIAGGFVLVPVRQIMAAWRACRRRPLGVADFRTWLACREMVARRCTLEHGRAPAYGLAELSRLTGVSPKRARASVKRLVAAGLLTWSDEVIGFPDAGDTGRRLPRRHHRRRARRPRHPASHPPTPGRRRTARTHRHRHRRPAPMPGPGQGGVQVPRQGQGRMDRTHLRRRPPTRQARQGRAHRPRMDRPRARRPVGHESVGARLPHRPRLGPGRPPRGSAIATPSRPGRPPIATP